MFRTALTCLLLYVSVVLSAADESAVKIDVSKLAKTEHPRLLMHSSDFEKLKVKLDQSQGGVLARLHDTIMVMSENMLRDDEPLTYTFDASKKRILHISRSALKRITSASYAYRMTEDRRFLDYAESNLNTVCDFPDWNQSHFLDVAEMALAVAIGYDWLYDDLSLSTRENVEAALNDYAVRHALNPKLKGHFYKRENNWNQVCNGGMVATAIALCDKIPEKAAELIEKAVESNKKPMEVMYSPDGNYLEGYSYWQYGTLYEVYMLKMLEMSFGTDYGLSEIPGFLDTGDFMLFMQGIKGSFNHSDNSSTHVPSVGMWYFADKLKRPDLLYNELRHLDSGIYTVYSDARLLSLVMCFAMNIDFNDIDSPDTNVWYGRGGNPVFIARKDWSESESDAYLAVKGGMAFNNHGHMDAGSFVYDAYGERWSYDLGAQTYALLEKAFAGKGSLWNKEQSSLRWTVARYDNYHHSTITVNDAHHAVRGMSEIKEHFDDRRGKGAVLDMTAPLAPHVESAERTVTLLDDNSLKVVDRIVSPDSASVKYSWRMLTMAVPTVQKNCIHLDQGDVRMTLKAKSNVRLEYRTWSAEPKQSYDEPNPGYILVGIEATVPAGRKADFTVTLSK